MTNEFTKELMAITQYAISSDTVYTESKVREMLKDLLNEKMNELSNEKVAMCEEELKKDCEETYTLLYKDRRELVKSFEKWCKEASADKYSQENVIAWMQMKGLIDINKAIELLNGKRSLK